MVQREVVVNFFFKYKWSGIQSLRKQEVALFRHTRSSNGIPSQTEYGPLVGYMYEDDFLPEVAAAKTIEQNFDLIPHQDTVIEFRGSSFQLPTGSNGRWWTVHPFSWTLHVDEDRLSTGDHKEQGSWKWFGLDHCFSCDTSDYYIKRLNSCLQRVYFGPHGMFEPVKTLMNRDNSAGYAFLKALFKA